MLCREGGNNNLKTLKLYFLSFLMVKMGFKNDKEMFFDFVSINLIIE